MRQLRAPLKRVLFATVAVITIWFELSWKCMSMTRTQIPGRYRNVPIPPYSAICGDFMRVSRIEPAFTAVGAVEVIPHQYISFPLNAQGAAATSCVAGAVRSSVTRSSATVLRRNDRLEVDANNSLLRALVADGARFFVGTENGARLCGGALLEKDSKSVWFAPKRTIDTKAGGAFRFRFQMLSKYVYYFSERAPCLYRGDARTRARVVTVALPLPKPVLPAPSVAGTSGEGEMNEGRTGLEEGEQILEPVDIGTSGEGEGVGGGGVGGVGGGGGSANLAEGVADNNSTEDDVDTVTVTESDSSTACFAASSRVWVSGGTKRMDKLAIGDAVEVGDGVFSYIFAFSHASPTARHMFVQLSTEHNRTLRVSGAHILLVRDVPTSARSVSVGDKIKDARFGYSQVRAVEYVRANGLFHPHTMHGDIIVDGVVLTTFTTHFATNPALAALLQHALLAPLRAAFAIAGAGVVHRGR